MNGINNSSSSIPCFYFCPEDGESVNELNCFFIPLNGIHHNITLKDVKENFPFEGEYVFRLGVSHNVSGEWLWLDRKEDEDLFVDGQRIILKVTRQSWQSVNRERPTFDTKTVQSVPAPKSDLSFMSDEGSKPDKPSNFMKEESPNLLL